MTLKNEPTGDEKMLNEGEWGEGNERLARLVADDGAWIVEPVLRRCDYGGWLGLSPSSAPVRIGVYGYDAQSARERYAVELAACRETLSRPLRPEKDQS